MNKVALTRLLSLIILSFFTLSGCKKEEGLGGTSTIRGKIIVYDFDASFQNPVPLKIYPAIDEDVYIIYGADGTIYDDDFKTSYDGSYEFKYLQKGNYRLFVYSKDSTGASIGNPSGNNIPVFINLEITSNGSTVDAPDIIILNNKAQ